MTRKSLGDRGKEAGAEAQSLEKAKPLKPVQCRGFMRLKLAEAFPQIVDGFVKEATRGSCQHVKLASELLERRVSTRPSTKKGTAQMLLDELDGISPVKREKDELGRWKKG